MQFYSKIQKAVIRVENIQKKSQYQIMAKQR